MYSAVSTLSPKSFSYYRFEYLGSFRDRNFEISKIKVTPRSQGDNVVEGIIYIVEDWWSIHSLDFNITKLGISFKVKQIYNPIEDKAWLPVSQTFKITGKVFGFEFEGDYLATVRDYKIKLNPALPQEMVVIDEKIQKEEAKVVKKQNAKKNQDLEQRLASGKEVTNKELKQLVKQYEKEELKEQKEPDVLSETKFSIDSLAYKKDSTFWTEMRPTPLTKDEVRGYKTEDSLTLVEKKKNEGDTLRKEGKKNKKGFQPWDILTGDSYKLTETSNFTIHAPYGGFNTVEGFNAIYRTSLYKRWVKKDSLNKKALHTYRLEVSPVLRYSFAREKATGFLRFDFRAKDYRLTLEGGRYVRQYNSEEPIHHFVNTFTTLVLGDNLMKIYERDFVDLNYRHRFNDKFALRSNWSWAKRSELFNNSSYTLFKINRDQYTPNAPVNTEIPTTSFQPNTAFIGMVSLEARPWQKYRIRNGRKQRIDNSSPILSFEYRKGFNGLFNSSVDFDLIELGIRKQLKIGIRGVLDVSARGGAFLNAQSMSFMDFKHFLGNRTLLTTSDPIGSYRLMDYYAFSTYKDFLSLNTHYHFRKFMLTRFAKIRMLGITENIFVNYLATNGSTTYTELGYSIDGILRIFRLEGAVSFRENDFNNLDYGFRIGIATSVTVNFND
jgi:hypothetical protein